MSVVANQRHISKELNIFEEAEKSDLKHVLCSACCEQCYDINVCGMTTMQCCVHCAILGTLLSQQRTLTMLPCFGC